MGIFDELFNEGGFITSKGIVPSLEAISPHSDQNFRYISRSTSVFQHYAEKYGPSGMLILPDLILTR